MNKKIVRNIAIILTVGIIISIISAIGVNIWGFSKQIEYENKNSKTDEEIKEIVYNNKYDNYYEPIIDSLVYSDPKNALSYINKVIKLYPKKSELEYYNGIAYYQIDSFDLAITSFKKSMEMRGFNSPRNLNIIGWSYYYLEKYDESINYLKKASDTNESYLSDVALFYEMQSDYKSAIKYYKIVLENMENSNMRINWYKEISALKIKISELEKLNK
jgi:tetratricopeptide (TPR) repeat protein